MLFSQQFNSGNLCFFSLWHQLGVGVVFSLIANEDIFTYKLVIVGRKALFKIEDAFERAVKDDKKTFMLWVNDNVRKEIQGYVRCKYLGQTFNVLKKNNSYLKIKDMGVEEHAELFSEE